MTDENINEMIHPYDEEWDTAVAALSDEELLAYMERFRDTIANNRDLFGGVTDEMIQELRAKAEGFQKSVDNARVAQRNLDIANKVVEHAADELLRLMPDTGKGN